MHKTTDQICMNNLLKKYAAGRFDIYNSITYSFSRLSLNKAVQNIRIIYMNNDNIQSMLLYIHFKLHFILDPISFNNNKYVEEIAI